jgi:hypothetical protein
MLRDAPLVQSPIGANAWSVSLAHWEPDAYRDRQPARLSADGRARS